MTLFDGAFALLLVAAGIGGYRLGFLARLASWLGLGVGLYFAARFLPEIIDTFGGSTPDSRLTVSAVALVVGAFAGQAIGLILGGRLRGTLPLGPLRSADRIVGAGVGVLGVVAALWLLLPSMAVVPGWPARTAAGSTVARWLNRDFPHPPNTIEALRRLVGNDTFPEIFNSSASSAVGPAPTVSPLSAAVTDRVTQSVVKVEGEACDRIQDGSGFAIADDLIFTNAHVVAGEPQGQTRIILPDGRQLPARVVVFDSARDVALLSVPGLGQDPLTLGSGSVGDTGAVFGHPGGQAALAVQPAAVDQDVTALGRNLYDTHNTRRDVYILASHLAPGDSGGALVNTAGQVIGVAFAISPDNPGTAYALTSKEMRAALSEPRSSAVVPTGPCLND